jgi:hypothetical protein
LCNVDYKEEEVEGGEALSKNPYAIYLSSAKANESVGIFAQTAEDNLDKLQADPIF